MTSCSTFTARAALSLLGVLLAACSGSPQDGASDEHELETPSEADPAAAELQNGSGPPGQVTLIDEQGKPHVWHYELVDGVAIAEGDIELGTLEELEQMAKGVVRVDHLWPRRTVVYTLNDNLTAAQLDQIDDAMDHWTAMTGLVFRYRGSGDADYVEFKMKTSGCSASYTGMKGGRQTISIQPRVNGKGCSTGNIIHEIGHTVGFKHEHTRSDRDDDINYYPERVEEGKETAFDKNGGSSYDDYYDIDFGSIMMYGSWTFSAIDGVACKSSDNGCLPPMTRTDANESTWSSQRRALSATDIQTFRTLYPRFVYPAVDNRSFISTRAGRRQFCRDNGYVDSASYSTRTVPGSNIVASWNDSAKRWDFVVDVTPPISDHTVVQSITCRF